MQISDAEVKKVLEATKVVEAIEEVAVAHEAAQDAELIQDVVAQVVEMPDREDRIAELRARIAAGTYNPTGAEIADAMVRRAIADRLR